MAEFDLSTAAGRETEKQYRMLKHRIKKADALSVKAKPNDKVAKMLNASWKQKSVPCFIDYSEDK